MRQPGHGVVATRQSLEMSVGPLPSPETLAKYEHAHPGLAERIVAMAESQSNHRRSIELVWSNARIEDRKTQWKDRRRGQTLAFFIVVIFAAAGTYTATHGAPWPGALLGGTGVTGLVALFLRSHHDPSKEEKDT